ncbi:MAG: hypothetical protein ACD_17C00490G0001 [uncultured bacterium]|nr:MAG: hypothetical protein ACD_17C00490G0001 [uncultured bacterium]
MDFPFLDTHSLASPSHFFHGVSIQEFRVPLYSQSPQSSVKLRSQVQPCPFLLARGSSAKAYGLALLDHRRELIDGRSGVLFAVFHKGYGVGPYRGQKQSVLLIWTGLARVLGVAPKLR